jgi:hypothetical protein
MYLQAVPVAMETDTSAASRLTSEALSRVTTFSSKVTEKRFRPFFKSTGEINIKVKFNKHTATLPLTVIKGQFPAQSFNAIHSSNWDEMGTVCCSSVNRTEG